MSSTCTISGCDKQLRSTNTIGLCREHRYEGDVLNSVRRERARVKREARPVRLCEFDDCDKRLRSDNTNGMCSKHYHKSEHSRSYRLAWRRERYATDAEYRNRSLKRSRDERNRPGVREARNAAQAKRIRERKATDPEYRERIKKQNRDYARDRRATDDEWREKTNARNRIYVERVGKGYAAWAIPLSQWQFNRCGICSEPMGADISVDHIYPVSLGGGNELANLQAVHRSCNTSKNNKYDLFALAGARG